MVVKGSRRALRTALIDLDDTLYRIPAITTGVRERIEDYMVEKLGIVREMVERVCRELYVSHGTTLAGLVAQGYEIDYDDWHAQVHGTIPYRQHLKPDPRLRELLFSLEMPKYVFTNADRKHAEVCLSLLGISDCFQEVLEAQGLICFESLQDQIHAVAGGPSSHLPVLCKPERKAFEMALLAAGNAEPHSTLFVDDSLRNVETAASMGITSVLVGSFARAPQAEHCIPDIFSLPAVMPGLFDTPGDIMVTPPPAVLEPASLVLEESETVAV